MSPTPQQPLPTTQLAALLRLYDDESQSVRHTVLQALASFGESLEAELKSLPAPPSAETLAAVLKAVAGHGQLSAAAQAAPSDMAQETAGLPEVQADQGLMLQESPHPAAEQADAEQVGSDVASHDRKPQRRGPRVRKRVLFEPGQLVRHRRYGYRGVIVAHDPTCRASQEWYENNRSKPEREQPWYHVLVDGASHVTYAAQTSLLPDEAMRAIAHPLVPFFFKSFTDGRYNRNERVWPSLEA